VVDPSGTAAGEASVVAVDNAKGIQHRTQTDRDGLYHFSGLPPAIYTLNVKSTGFVTEVRKNIVVVLGETTTIDFHLQVSEVASQVDMMEVKVTTPVVDVERGSHASRRPPFVAPRPRSDAMSLVPAAAVANSKNAARPVGRSKLQVAALRHPALEIVASLQAWDCFVISPGSAE
jgi:hypothetical protein